MTSLSTHVLDTMHGCPAPGLEVVLLGPDGEIGRGVTNGDGRCPDLAPESLAAGRYSLAFSVAAYFRSVGVKLPELPFLDVVTIAFGISDQGGHYHVPLLVSPYGYSTYRGS